MLRVPIAAIPLVFVLALCAILAAACGAENETVATTPRRAEGGDATASGGGPKVVFLGDSITAGLHLEDGLTEAFPAVLARLTAARELPFQPVNAGLSGDTSAGGLRRLDWLLKQEPDLLVVELGGNDALRGQPLEEIEANIAAIVAGARARGTQVMVLGGLIPPSYGEDYAEGFRALFARVARGETDDGLHFVPDFMAGVGGVPEFNYRDGLHPNAAGHRLLAEKLEPVFLAWLAGMKTRTEATKIAR